MTESVVASYIDEHPVPVLSRQQVLKQVWVLALPVMLTNFLQTLVNVVDVFMVGRLGPIAIAAAGMGNVIRMLVLVMMLAVATGAMTLIAQAKGARDPQRMSFVTRQSISSGFILGLILTVFGILAARPLLLFANSGGDPEAVVLGTRYLRILFMGTSFLVLNMIINRLMQGAGDTVTPLILTGSLNLLNIAFNYIFMFGPGPLPAFGIAGAAMGTVLARFLGMVIGIAIIYSGKNVVRLLPGSYRPDLQMVKDILSIGVPSGIQGVFRNGSRLLVISVLTSTEVGTYGAAALAIGLQVESLAFMPVLGINVASTSLVGQSLGRWQPAEARRRGNTAIGLGIVVMTVLAAPMIIFAPTIIHIFDPSAHPVLLESGVTYLRINTVALPLAAISMVANGSLRGAGDTMPGMMATLFARTIISVALAYLFGITLGFGSVGVWSALAIGVILNAIYMGWRWRGTVWIRVALHKAEIYRQHLQHLPEAVCQRYLDTVREPLMAQVGAFEEVHNEGVTYHLTDRDLDIVFDDRKYKLVEA